MPLDGRWRLAVRVSGQPGSAAVGGAATIGARTHWGATRPSRSRSASATTRCQRRQRGAAGAPLRLAARRQRHGLYERESVTSSTFGVARPPLEPQRRTSLSYGTMRGHYSRTTTATAGRTVAADYRRRSRQGQGLADYRYENTEYTDSSRATALARASNRRRFEVQKQLSRRRQLSLSLSPGDECRLGSSASCSRTRPGPSSADLAYTLHAGLS